MTPTHLVCPSPINVLFAPGDVIILQVTLNNGVSFVSSNVTITSSSCVSRPDVNEHLGDSIWYRFTHLNQFLFAWYEIFRFSTGKITGIKLHLSLLSQ